MKIEDIRPITYLKTHTADVLVQVNQTHRPMVITQNGEPRAVIQDAESFEKMHTALGLLKLFAQGEQDILHGRIKSQTEVFSRLEKKLKAKLKTKK